MTRIVEKKLKRKNNFKKTCFKTLWVFVLKPCANRAHSFSSTVRQNARSAHTSHVYSNNIKRKKSVI